MVDIAEEQPAMDRKFDLSVILKGYLGTEAYSSLAQD